VIARASPAGNRWPPLARSGDLPLHEAIKGEVTRPSRTGSPEVVKYLVELYPEAVKETNKYGEMALHIAIKKNALS
jgi:hypothetical protein